MKRLILYVSVMLVLAAGIAWADYGAWTQKYVSGGNYNNAFFAVDAPDEQTVFIAGVWSNNIDQFKFLWRSNDGGNTVVNIYQFTLSPDPGEMCDMLKITDARTSLAMTTANFGLFGGSSIDQDCIDSFGPDPLQQMICFIVCAMTIGPSIWYTEDNGETFEQAELPRTMEDSVQSIYMVDETIGYAGGLGSYIVKTTDGGRNWTALPALEADDYYINSIHFLDEDTGWLAIGEWDPDPEKGGEPLEGFAKVQEHLHRTMLGVNPAYRHAYWESLPKLESPKMLNGRILRTDDGGHTWTVQMQSAAEGYNPVHMIDENNGWVIGEEYNPNGGIVRVYRTTDGGENWDNVTDNLPANIPGASGGWYPTGVKFINPNFGFMYGIGAKVMSYVPIILYTTDGGETWTVDETILSLQGGQFDLVWVNNRLAYSVGLYINLLKYEGANAAPTANAGEDFTAEVGVAAQLDGTGSTDPDGDGLFYAWTQVSGPTLALDDATSATPTFTPGEVGTAVFELIVNDGELSSDPDQVTVTIVPPTDDDDTVDDDTADDDETDDDQAGDDDDNDDNDGCGC